MNQILEQGGRIIKIIAFSCGFHLNLGFPYFRC